MSKSSTKKQASAQPAKKGGAEASATTDSQVVPSFSSNTISSLNQLFISGIREIYWAENHLVKAIPKIIVAAGDAALQQSLQQHLSITKSQAARLEKVFELLGEKIVACKCDAMEGLTMSGEHIIENTQAGSPARDMGIIMSGIKVENFETTTYKGLIQLATSAGQQAIADLLQQSMEEELEAADNLTALSENADKQGKNI